MVSLSTGNREPRSLCIIHAVKFLFIVLNEAAILHIWIGAINLFIHVYSMWYTYSLWKQMMIIALSHTPITYRYWLISYPDNSHWTFQTSCSAVECFFPINKPLLVAAFMKFHKETGLRGFDENAIDQMGALVPVILEVRSYIRNMYTPGKPIS